MDSGNTYRQPILRSPFNSFRGTVIEIYNQENPNRANRGCVKQFLVQNSEGTRVNLIIAPDTYFVEQEKVSIGTPIIGYYDAGAPAVMIYPPQFRAIVIAVERQWDYLVKVDMFDNDLVSADGTLKLNLQHDTEIILENGQDYDGVLEYRSLAVVYKTATKSMPAQTTPQKIILIC